MEDLLDGTVLDGVKTLPAGSWFHAKALSSGRTSMRTSALSVLEVLGTNGEPLITPGLAVLESERAFIDTRTGLTFPGSSYVLVDANGALELSAAGSKRLRAGRALGWFHVGDHLDALERQDLSALKRLVALGAFEQADDVLEEHVEMLEFDAGRGSYQPRSE